MRSRRATAPNPAAPSPPDDGYRSLSVAEVLADLPSLEAEQLLTVKSLEESGERRPVILDRIDDLLVVQEAAHHLQGSRATAVPPAASDKAISADLLDQMGGLLAKDSVRRSSAAAAALAPPALPPPAAGGKAARGTRKVPPAAPNGLIVPTDGRKSRRGRGARLLVRLIIVALVAGAGGLAWQQTRPTTAMVKAGPTPVGDPLASRLIGTAPGGYSRLADAVGDSGPADLAKAARHDGAPDAQPALAQAGFLHGFQRVWDTPDKHQLVVTLYHFRTAEGASSYSQRVAAATTTNAITPPATLAIAGIPGAVGLSGADGSAHWAQAVFTRGIYWASVTVRGPVAATVESVAQQVAASQYATLPAG